MRRAALLAAVCALACVGQPTLPRARVAIEIWSGFREPASPPELRAPRVELLLDVTHSMRERSPGAPGYYAGARESAARLVESLPGGASVGVWGLGVSRGAECAEPTRLAQGRVDLLRGTLPDRLRNTWPGREGSLPVGLDTLRLSLGEAVDGARVVVFSDLGAQCGGDLCAAASRLVARGARLELVVLGDAETPACLADLAPANPPALANPAPAPLPTFRVHAHAPGASDPGPLLAEGVADGTPLAVPAGPVLLVVEMEPPALVGPMQLLPENLTQVRILDFPTLDPPVREWRWDVVPDLPADGGS